MSDFKERLEVLIKSGAPIVQIVSFETLRVYSEIKKVAKETDRKAFVWSLSEGLREFVDKKEKPVEGDYGDASLILEWFSESERENTILLLEDYHPNLSIDNHPEIISMLRSIYKKTMLNDDKNTLVLLQHLMLIPPEMEKEIQILELPLPNEDEILTIMRSVKRNFNIDDRDYEEDMRLVDAALGLSTSEVMSAFSCVAVKRKKLTLQEIPLIVSEKKQVISKRGMLDYFEPEQNMKDIGGLDNLKIWLDRRRNAFSQEAYDFGLEVPRGIMLLGLPGTGKSLAAKAVANSWQMPLLRLDMGRIFEGFVGKSESNIRSALDVAEAVAPCVLWVDEIEKGMSGIQSSGETDGGVTARVLGTFLTWMQEKKKPVFVVATANNIRQLPPELLRKGRVDEIFFVDLPTKKERVEILRIHLEKRKRKFKDAELETLAEVSIGFTGAELEEAVKEGMYRAFSQDRDLIPEDIKVAIDSTTPLSKTMSEGIAKTREWSKGRAVPASSEEPEPLLESKGMVVLKQERGNPFDDE